MSLTIPDKGEAASDLQSIFFQEYLDVLVAGINGIDCVLSGGAVTAQGSPDMTVAVAKAAVLANGVLKAVAAANATITAAHATNPRLDLVVINSAGAIAVRAGTPGVFDPDLDLAPKSPARTANDVVLAVVYVPANDTTIAANQITDMRVLRTQGPITIHKVTSPVTFNTTSAIQTYLSLVVPNGLLLSTRGLRVRMGGNMLTNSGTPTMTLTIAYGGTTLYADASAALGASATRRAWSVTFDLIAQANNDQSLVGRAGISVATGATTGLGDAAGSGGGVTGFDIGGSAAVDSDAADQTLTLQWTMSVSNAAVETVMELATVDLI